MATDVWLTDMDYGLSGLSRRTFTYKPGG